MSGVQQQKTIAINRGEDVNILDAVVIGAGVGGLAAAIGMASQGMRVAVLEAASEPGGKAGVTYSDGVEIDTGPSVLTMPDVFEELLQLAGISLHEHLRLLRPEPSFRYLYPDGTVLDIHHDIADTLQSVCDTLGAAAADELTAFLSYSQRIWEAAAPQFVYGDAPNLKNVLMAGFSGWSAIGKIDPWRNMWSAIQSRVQSPHLRRLLARYATYNGSDVRRAPATLNCIAHVELALGGYGVEGGMYQLVRLLVRAAEKVGAQIHCGCPVSSVILERGQVRGVELHNGRTMMARRVVANADVAHLIKRLLPAGTRHGISQSGEPSMSGYNLVMKARRRHGDARRVAHTVAFCDDYAQEFADIFDRDRPPVDPTVYLCAQEVCHGRRGWDDHEPVFVMANAPAQPLGEAPEDGRWQALEQAVLTRMQRYGLTEPGDEIVWQRTPRQLAERFWDSRGSIYGLASNGPTAAFQRPPNRVPKIGGLFLASGGAHPGGGVPLAALSGRAAARAALKMSA